MTPRRPSAMRPRCRRAKPESASPRRKLIGSRVPLARVEVDHARKRPPADRAERDLVPREHDAVFLGPVQTLRLVQGPFERPDLPGVLVGPEQLRLVDQLLPEEL